MWKMKLIVGNDYHKSFSIYAETRKVLVSSDSIKDSDENSDEHNWIQQLFEGNLRVQQPKHHYYGNQDEGLTSKVKNNKKDC